MGSACVPSDTRGPHTEISSRSPLYSWCWTPQKALGILFLLQNDSDIEKNCLSHIISVLHRRHEFRLTADRS